MKHIAKHGKSRKNKKDRKILLFLLISIFLCSIAYIGYNLYSNFKNVKDNQNILSDVKIDTTQITDTKTERVLQLEQLKKINEDIVAWIEIEGTNINYPVLQGTDNDYYLNHNYKKEEATTGSLFLDKSYDFSIPSSNLLIYGHRNKQGLMFEDLIKYADKEFYKEHPIIKFTTTKDDEFEIISVFYSRVYYKSEKNVFRYYYFVNAKNEEEFNDYVQNSKKVSIYDTAKTAEYGDQLLTLSTCEYGQENGRFVVVARKVKK